MRKGSAMRKIFSFFSFILIFALVFALSIVGSYGEEKRDKNGASKEEKPYVFTNDDLQKYAVNEQSGAEEQEEATYESVAETIQKIKAPEEVQKWKEARLQTAEAKVKEAEQQLDYLKKKQASIHNPFLPRPEPTDEDLEKEAGMDNVKRSERTEKQIEEAQEGLQKAEDELMNLQKEFKDAGI